MRARAGCARERSASKSAARVAARKGGAARRLPSNPCPTLAPPSAGHLNMHKSRRRVNALGANKAVLQPSIRKRYLRMLGM